MAKVFHTPWFLFLLGLLALNLILCSWEKSVIALTLYWRRHFLRSPSLFEKLPYAAEITGTPPTADITETLQRKFTVVRQDGNAWYAQKGLLSRCGATIIHIGLLWVMAAGLFRIYADDFGWGVYDATIILPEGKTTDVYYSRIDRLKKPVEGNLRARPLPFNIRALDFRAEYYPNSSVAKSFSSLVEVSDGRNSEIAEISMAHPLVYGGFKITQNSFSENPQVVRGKFSITDRETGQTYVLDVSPNDPVRIPMAGEDNTFFQASAIEGEIAYKIFDLRGNHVLQEGRVEQNPASMTLEDIERTLSHSRYALVIPALFPNFRIGSDGLPTTENEHFENPAILAMFYKNGKPNGSLWLFLHEAAQSVMGQPHPEIEAYFRAYRKRGGTASSSTLFDYEVLVELRQRFPPKLLGKFWIQPGTVFEIPDVDPKILSAPNVSSMPRAAHSSSLVTTTSLAQADPLKSASAETTGSESTFRSLSDGTTTPSKIFSHLNDETTRSISGQAVEASATTSQPMRFEVSYQGTTSGHVTYLGMIKDPAIPWIYVGCLIILVGTMVAFFITYREVWIWRDESSGKTYVGMAIRRRGLPYRPGEFADLVQRLSATLQPSLESSDVPSSETRNKCL